MSAGTTDEDEAAFTSLVRRAMDGDGPPFALARVEFDRIDRVAEFFGEGVAEYVRDELVLRLRECAREPSAALCPEAGSALILVPVDSTAVGDLATAAWSLMERLSAAIDVGMGQVSIGCTVGIAEPGVLAERSVAGLINAASTAGRRAASMGSRRAVVFEGTHETSGRRGTRDRSLFEALMSDQIQAWYQPRVRLRDGAIVGVQALARWDHPVYRIVAAHEFVPEAQWSGLVRDIDRRVVAHALRSAATWPEDVRVAMNLSDASLDHPGVVAEVESNLASSGLSPRRVTFTVGGTGSARNLEGRLRRLAELKDVGVRLSLAGWGAAHAYIDVLGDGLFDEVAIGRPWVRGWAGRPVGDSLGALVALAASVGLETVAVGIETEQERQVVVASGCQVGQGDLLYPVQPEARLRDLLGPLDDPGQPATRGGTAAGPRTPAP